MEQFLSSHTTDAFSTNPRSPRQVLEACIISRSLENEYVVPAACESKVLDLVEGLQCHQQTTIKSQQNVAAAPSDNTASNCLGRVSRDVRRQKERCVASALDAKAQAALAGRHALRADEALSGEDISLETTRYSMQVLLLDSLSHSLTLIYISFLSVVVNHTHPR